MKNLKMKALLTNRSESVTLGTLLLLVIGGVAFTTMLVIILVARLWPVWLVIWAVSVLKGGLT